MARVPHSGDQRRIERCQKSGRRQLVGREQRFDRGTILRHRAFTLTPLMPAPLRATSQTPRRFDRLETAAGRLAEPLAVPGDGVDVRERVLHDVGQCAQHRVVERREPVMDPQSFPPGLDQARAPEVTRGGGRPSAAAASTPRASRRRKSRRRPAAPECATASHPREP